MLLNIISKITYNAFYICLFICTNYILQCLVCQENESAIFEECACVNMFSGTCNWIKHLEIKQNSRVLNSEVVVRHHVCYLQQQPDNNLISNQLISYIYYSVNPANRCRYDQWCKAEVTVQSQMIIVFLGRKLQRRSHTVC